jgi:hypothetical protein
MDRGDIVALTMDPFFTADRAGGMLFRTQRHEPGNARSKLACLTGNSGTYIIPRQCFAEPEVRGDNVTWLMGLGHGSLHWRGPVTIIRNHNDNNAINVSETLKGAGL